MVRREEENCRVRQAACFEPIQELAKHPVDVVDHAEIDRVHVIEEVVLQGRQVSKVRDTLRLGVVRRLTSKVRRPTRVDLAWMVVMEVEVRASGWR